MESNKDVSQSGSHSLISWGWMIMSDPGQCSNNDKYFSRPAIGEKVSIHQFRDGERCLIVSATGMIVADGWPLETLKELEDAFNTYNLERYYKQ